MSTRASCILLALIFCALVSAESAHAQCAWVLWADRASSMPVLVPDGFERVAAFDTYGRCASAAKHKAEFQASEASSRAAGGVTTKIVSRVQDQWTVEITQSNPYRLVIDTFFCLLDTMDPRAPKAK